MPEEGVFDLDMGAYDYKRLKKDVGVIQRLLDNGALDTCSALLESAINSVENAYDNEQEKLKNSQTSSELKRLARQGVQKLEKLRQRLETLNLSLRAQQEVCCHPSSSVR